jgi:TetR/AcrR family transcriptional regulator
LNQHHSFRGTELAKNELKLNEPVPRRRQQRTIETRQKIMKAALAEFARRGFENTSTREIADSARVPHSLVIYHFGSKEDLWYETVKDAVGSYTRHSFGALEPVGDGDPEVRLRKIFARYIRFSAEFPDFFRMMTHENMVGSKRLAWLVKNHVEPSTRHLTELIRRAQKQGTFVKGDPIRLLYIFLGTATVLYRSARELELLTGKAQDTPAAIANHIALCERLFFLADKD